MKSCRMPRRGTCLISSLMGPPHPFKRLRVSITPSVAMLSPRRRLSRRRQSSWVYSTWENVSAALLPTTTKINCTKTKSLLIRGKGHQRRNGKRHVCQSFSGYQEWRSGKCLTGTHSMHCKKRRRQHSVLFQRNSRRLQHQGLGQGLQSQPLLEREGRLQRAPQPRTPAMKLNQPNGLRQVGRVEILATVRLKLMIWKILRNQKMKQARQRKLTWVLSRLS
mmetsp:Transcript_54079/g.161892  ORF Transcript_54079/g.161892 Transcript_54079/m.161892 type:complete len:221 (+) Transcript_54079:2689-3351(+)